MNKYIKLSIAGLCIFSAQQHVNAQNDIEFGFWANQTSNVIDASFMNTLGEGGFISAEDLDPVLFAHAGENGYLGVNAGWDYKWITPREEGTPWSTCGSLGSEVIVDTRWTSDLFELIWYGNAGHTGRVDVLSGSGARVGAFNRLSIGGYNHDTKQRIEVSLVQRALGAEWTLPYGYLYVSENADSLDTYLQSEARIHADEDGNFITSYGIGIRGSFPMQSEELPMDFLIEFKDVGILSENAGSQVYWVNDGIETTGLPVLGDSLTWESLVNGDLSTDSVLMTGESVSRSVLLPAQFSVSANYELSSNFDLRAKVFSGGWMPEPLVSGGFAWDVTEDFELGLELRDGGWGNRRFAVWTKVNVSEKKRVHINFESPLGYFITSNFAQETTCRGVSFRLEKRN